MNPPRYPACPARRRRSFSSSVSGQVKPANSTSAPYITAGMCAQTIQGHRQARNTPPMTKPMNSRWMTTRRSAAALYHICHLPREHTRPHNRSPAAISAGPWADERGSDTAPPVARVHEQVFPLGGAGGLGPGREADHRAVLLRHMSAALGVLAAARSRGAGKDCKSPAAHG